MTKSCPVLVDLQAASVLEKEAGLGAQWGLGLEAGGKVASDS